MASFLKRFFENIRPWQWGVLGLCGIWTLAVGSRLLSESVRSSDRPAPITIEELESGPPKNPYRILGAHAPIPKVAVVKKATTKKVSNPAIEAAFYPVVSQRADSAAVIRVLVKTNRFKTEQEALSANLPKGNLAGTVISEDLLPIVKSTFVNLNLAQNPVIFKEGRIPAPLWWASASCVIGTMMLLACAWSLFLRPRGILRISRLEKTRLEPPASPEAAKRAASIWTCLFGGGLFLGMFLAGIAAGVGGFDLRNEDVETSGNLCVFALMTLILPTTGRLSKRYNALATQDDLSKDTRAPVLYLRSFNDDEVSSRTAESPSLSSLLSFISPMGAASLILYLASDQQTEEELLVKALSGIGPCVAIGKPGEPLPEKGAIRVYVSDAEWQDTVRSYMERASLVVLRFGYTRGFQWELGHCSKKLDPRRLVVLVPFNRYEQFKSIAASLKMRALLPEGSRWFESRSGLGSLHGFMYFERDWTPRYVRIADCKPSSNFFSGAPKLFRLLAWGLNPVYEQLEAVDKPTTPSQTAEGREIPPCGA